MVLYQGGTHLLEIILSFCPGHPVITVLENLTLDICQRLRGRKIWECPGGATQNTLPCPMVASFGLRNRDIHDFSACVMSDADVTVYLISA